MVCAFIKVRGNTSIGTLLQNAGLCSIPSNSTPAQPNMNDKWFSGGYITRTYANSTVETVQLEFPKHMRFTEENRNSSVPKISIAIIKLIEIWIGPLRYPSYAPSLVPSKSSSMLPSVRTYGVPSVQPLRNPSDLPSIFPFKNPALCPLIEPSGNPSQSPTICVDKE
uniref:Uncharacterized protein n=1 Tax=Corethron hystrix TaxID=216773 RepID=A0A7S1BPY3_9STRA|mmetsp:Transcript_36562/g.85469  ORF Transcript_36562/g.85469 Transcript_36562/m.85469 type:complete len:167 (+) Transcript_36562:278-778(+)